MSQLNVPPWGQPQRGLPLYLTCTLAIAGMLSVVHTSSAGTPSFAVESAVVVARGRGALLGNVDVSFCEKLMGAVQELVCVDCASSYAKPVAGLIIALAAALIVFGMHSGVPARAEH